MARFVNLCCALGPRFDHQPENEWALAILADDRLAEWVKLHQLVVRGSFELKRRGTDGTKRSSQLLLADAALLDQLDQAARVHSGDPKPLARQSCDLEAVQIGLLETDWRREYRNTQGAWKLPSLPAAPRPLRIAHGQHAPAMISVLTHPANSKLAARLQVRVLNHSLCDRTGTRY